MALMWANVDLMRQRRSLGTLSANIAGARRVRLSMRSLVGQR
jgi:hypothetical protein